MLNMFTACSRRAASVIAVGVFAWSLWAAAAMACPASDAGGSCAKCAAAKGAAAGHAHGEEAVPCPNCAAGKEACPHHADGAAGCKDGAAGCKDCDKGKEGADAPCPCAKAAAEAAAAQQGQAAPANAAQQRAYIDPATGKLTTPPANTGGAASETAPARVGGVVEPVPGPDGGVKARLGEGFRANVRAERTPTGEAHVDCDHGAGGETGKSASAEPVH